MSHEYSEEGVEGSKVEFNLTMKKNEKKRRSSKN